MRDQGSVVPSLYTSTGLRKYLNAAERMRFIAAAKACPRPEVCALCLTLVYTGCRISEALSLTTTSIEAESGFIAIRSLKKRKRGIVVREVPVPADLLNVLFQAPFVKRLSRDKLWGLSRSRAWQLIKAVMVEARISAGPHQMPKGLRHGYGIHAIRSGIPLNLVQRWLGQARMETTAIYLQAMGSEERELAARMWVNESTHSAP